MSIDLTVSRRSDDIESRPEADTPTTAGFDELLLSGRIRDLEIRDGPMRLLVESLPTLDASVGTVYSVALTDDLIDEQLGSWDVQADLSAGRLPPVFGWRITVPATSHSLVDPLSTAVDVVDGCRLVRRPGVVSLEASNDPMRIPWQRIVAFKKWTVLLGAGP